MMINNETNNEKDYFFYIIWEDDKCKKYRIGVLAQLDKMFYLRMHKKGQSISVEDNKEETAYDNGCIGITAFKRDVVYRSEELFDFFKSRILHKNLDNPCEELKAKKARSMVDSFSVEEIPEDLRKDCKETILGLYKMQEKNKDIEGKSKAHSM